jgi:hypothetical protein
MPERKPSQPRIRTNLLKTSRRRAKPRQFASYAAEIILALTISACSAQVTAVPPQITQVSLPIKASVQVATATPVPVGAHIGDSVPAALRKQFEDQSVRLDISTSSVQSAQSNEIQWVYALVAPFPTLTDGVTFDELKVAWMEGPAAAPASFNRVPLLMEESTLAAFTALWDEPAPGAVRVVSADRLLDEAWSDMPAWAIIPFEKLEPKWKVLTIDGQSPVRKNFDLTKYPLIANFKVQSSNGGQQVAINNQPSNYDPSKLTTIVMTGITAFVRATALTMERKGILYPGEKIRDVLREADIAHIANHVPFSTGCAFPKPDQVALVFCSDPKYIDLLTDVGTDVVELTGHHFEDYGPKATLETLAIYEAHNIVYFGGGANKQDAIKPALFENHGNKIAFIGCNRLDTGGPATATDTLPGAAPCDYPYLRQEIGQLRSEGYVVIATMHWNQTYDYRPNPQQIIDFRFLADSGASLVLGSQAHYAQTMEFYNGIFIHYGQGNLFFDQMGDQDWMPKGIRREFLDRYVIYNGKLISIELITTMLEDYSRPRLMTEQERAGFLQEYFYKSGWIPFSPTPTPTITPTLTPMSIPTFSGTSNLLSSTTATPKP